jgi:NAD(P)-dependent dehydrogenase (short-subunit alcohol dehydrogenase family)
MPRTVLITGANRGIGYGLATQFLKAGWDVVAAARNPDGARELWELERDYPQRCRIVTLDVTNDADVRKLADLLAGKPLDVLVNNAGVMPESGVPFARVSADAMLKAFSVNVLGPMRVTQELLPSLTSAERPVVATITSKMGSVADNTSGGSYAYRVSKAAVNMLSKSLTCDQPKLTCLVLHPGWVQTDMGGRGAPTSIDESTQGLFQVITKAQPKDSGRFLDFRGQEIPW